jgi:hypothetical protein
MTEMPYFTISATKKSNRLKVINEIGDMIKNPMFDGNTNSDGMKS